MRPDPDEITLAAVGDIMLGSDWPAPLLPSADILRPVAPLLRRADIAFGNLEGPLYDGGRVRPDKADPARSFAFRTPTRYAAYLKDAGFDFLSVANNHASDFQAPGRRSTLEALDRQGIQAVGAPDRPRVQGTVRGTTLFWVGFSTGGVSANLNDIDRATTLVRRASSRGLTIVSFHGGAEGADRQHVPVGPETFRGEPRGDLRRFARCIIEAGASLVLGHGPHVLRGLEIYRGRLIAYSLGNFATYGGISIRGVNGVTMILQIRLAPDGRFCGGEILPCVQTGRGGPRPDPKGQAIPLVQRLSRADFGAGAPLISRSGRIAPLG